METRDRQVVLLPVNAIRSTEPRQMQDPTALRALAASIARCGVLQPLSVRPAGQHYTLIHGEKRLRAARLAGLGEVPCLLTDGSRPAEPWEQLRRLDADYITQAQTLAQMMERSGMRQGQIACRLGKSQSAIANRLRLLQHPPAVLEALRQYRLSERHARALLRVPEEQRLPLIGRIAAEGWTVAQLEQYLEHTVPTQNVTRLLQMVEQAGLPCHRQEENGEIVLTIRMKKTAVSF